LAGTAFDNNLGEHLSGIVVENRFGESLSGLGLKYNRFGITFTQVFWRTILGNNFGELLWIKI